MRTLFLILSLATAPYAHALPESKPVAVYYGPETDRFLLVEANAYEWSKYVLGTIKYTAADRSVPFQRPVRVFIGPRDNLLPRRIQEIVGDVRSGYWDILFESGGRLRVGPNGFGHYYDPQRSQPERLNALEFAPEEIDVFLNVRRGGLEAKSLRDVCDQMITALRQFRDSV